MPDYDLLSFVEKMGAVAIGLDHAMEHAVERAAVILEDSAKAAIGTYEFDWPQLAAATQRDRVAKGFTPNDPLLRTGALQASIEHKVSGPEGVVGTNHPVAPYQEFGTSRIPARPFLGGALAANEDRLGNVIAEEIGRVI